METTKATEEFDIKELLEGNAAQHSKIAEIEVMKASEIFGDKAKNPDRDVAKIKTENGADLTLTIPKGLSYDNDTWKMANKLQATRSIRNRASKFGGFLRRYGRWPHKGLEVETDLDDDAFARIVV